MNKLYQKDETIFAIVWIIIYVVTCSIGDSISAEFGFDKAATFPILIIMSAALVHWIHKNHLDDKYGLCAPKRPLSDLLYYIPLVLLIAARMTRCFSISSPAAAVLDSISMLFVGFMEEVIFRGLLFRAMEQDGLKSAIVVSAVTFGIGHIVNLMNGSGMTLTENMVQICFAILFGFLTVFLAYYGGSLWPCIVIHGLWNAIGVLTNDTNGLSLDVILGSVIIIGYCMYLLSKIKRQSNA